MSDEKSVVVYVSKYALTSGIFMMNASIRDEIARQVGVLYPHVIHGKGKDWHFTEAEAIKAAEGMRDKKLVSIAKQIKKLENLTFTCKNKEAFNEPK